MSFGLLECWRNKGRQPSRDSSSTLMSKLPWKVRTSILAMFPALVPFTMQGPSSCRSKSEFRANAIQQERFETAARKESWVRLGWLVASPQATLNSSSRLLLCLAMLYRQLGTGDRRVAPSPDMQTCGPNDWTRPVCIAPPGSKGPPCLRRPCFGLHLSTFVPSTPPACLI